MTDQKEDLDAFLTGVESKLRGPFSSLDLAKAVTTTALRGSLTPTEYIHMIGKVIGRTDKVIQCRMLVGLLGLDPSADLNVEIYKVLQQTQEAPLHEEWVRTVSGLIQGIMFHQHSQSSRELSRGEEAKTLLSKTCTDICQQVQALEEDETPDMNAYFEPYKYSLLDSNILSSVMPESNTNPHFSVNQDSPILQMDAKLELEKAKEEHEHKQHLPTKGPAMAKTNATDTLSTKAVPGVPVFRPTKITATKTPGGSSAMFMPKKPNPMLQARGGGGGGVGGGAAKTSLHTRKAGAAQSLLMKNRLKQQRMAGKTTVAAANTTGTKIGGGGRAAALQRSKMKMIDVTEVDTLNKEHAKRDDQMTRTEKLQSRKRKILDAAAKQGLVSKKKVEPASVVNIATNGATATTVPNSNYANANTNAEAPAVAEPPPQPPQVQTPVPPQPAAVDLHMAAAQQQQQQQQANGTAKSSQEWQVLLADRSNKLSSEDRFRVKQFFEEHYNPTPDQSVYKMKLHEERTHDTKTGAAIKETYYLELDYSTFTSKQSKKVKRY
jgi:hypothetical protein